VTPGGWLYGASFASGASALVFQVAWVRQLSLVIGASTPSLTLGLSTYMAGLSLGSWLGPRAAGPAAGRARRYRTVELAIAVLAVGLTRWLAAAASQASGGGRGELVGPLAGLLLVTVLVGMTSPILAGCLPSAGPGMTRGIGWLYATNTLGAATGALAAGLVLIEVSGVSGLCWYGAVGNLAAALMVTRAAPALRDGVDGGRGRGDGDGDGGGEAEMQADASRGSDGSGPAGLALASLALGSSAAGMALEILTTRGLTMLCSTHAYALSLALGGLLLGLALGGGLPAVAPGLSSRPHRSLGLVFAALAAWSLLFTPAIVWLHDVRPDTFAWVAGDWPRYVAAVAGASLLLLLPAGVLLGCVPSLLAIALARSGMGASRGVGLVNAASGVGSVLGPPLASFVLLPACGTSGAFRSVGLALAATAVGLVVLPAAGRARDSGRWWLAAAIAGVLAPVVAVSRIDLPQALVPPDRRVVFTRESSFGGSTVIRDPDGTHRLMTNLHQFVGDDSAAGVRMQRRQYLIPALLAPSRERVLEIGVGTGITVSPVVRDRRVRELVAVDISPAVVEGAHRFVAANLGVLEDPRTRVVVDDGRSWLRRNGSPFDVILVELFNGEEKGIAALYSREFYELCRARLTARGVLGQSLSLRELPPHELFSVVNTLAQVFEHVGIWHAFPDILVVTASRSPIAGAGGRVREALEDRELGPIVRAAGIRRPEDLLGLHLADAHEPGLCDAAGIVTDDRPDIEFQVPRSLLFIGVGVARSAGTYRLLREHLSAAPESFTGPIDPAIRRRLELRGPLLDALSDRLEGAHARAAARLASILERDPSFGEAELLLVDVRHAHREKGRLLSDRAGSGRPADLVAHGLWLLEDSRPQEAAAGPLARARARDPDDPAVLDALALALARSGMLADAQRILERRVRVGPPSTLAWNNLGMVLLDQGLPDRAEAAFARALALEPGNPTASANLVRARAFRAAHPSPDPATAVAPGPERASPDGARRD
jgi:spermidine synthase